MKTEMDICQLRQIEFGTRQTLIMNPALEERKEYSFQMMD